MPENPDNPENPESPENPEIPENPGIPEAPKDHWKSAGMASPVAFAAVSPVAPVAVPVAAPPAPAPTFSTTSVPADFNYGLPFGSSATAASAAADSGECPVELAGRIAPAFVEDCTLALHFRVRGGGEFIPDARLKLCDGDDVLAMSQRRKIRAGAWADLPINYRPKCAGNFALRVLLEFGSERGGEAYESEVINIVVYPNDLREAKSVAVNISNEYNLTVDRAGDARISAASADIASAIRDARPGETVRQVLERCARGQTERRFPLHAAALPTRVTLVDAGGFALHVFSDDALRFGRSRDNDVVLRVFGEDGLPDQRLSRAVSKTHFRVRRSGLECQLVDGGPGRDEHGHVSPGAKSVKSTYGTSVAGRAVPPCGAWPLRPGAPQMIGVASAIPGASGAVLSLEATVGRCPEGRREGCGRHCPLAAATSLLLRRDDGVSEAYLVVWKCASLGDVFPALGGHTIVWDGDRFVVESPEGKALTIRPGVEIGPEDSPVSVMPYQQRFF